MKLLILATSIGITITEFWEITPLELNLAIKGYRKKKEAEANEYGIKFKNQRDLVVTQAWLTANWTRCNKMPGLDEVLKSSKERKVMTAEQMLDNVKLLNKMFGGEEIGTT